MDKKENKDVELVQAYLNKLNKDSGSALDATEAKELIEKLLEQRAAEAENFSADAIISDAEGRKYIIEVKSQPIVRPRLNDILKERGITQAELAERTNIPQGTISRFDKNERHVDWHVFAISAALGIDVKDLFDVRIPNEYQQDPGRALRAAEDPSEYK